MTAPEVPDPARLEVTVIGRVQGVGYRYYAWSEARGLGLTGWVHNDSDGSVRCLAEGPREGLRAFLAALERGPAGARVERVLDRWGQPTGGLPAFGIRSGDHPGD